VAVRAASNLRSPEGLADEQDAWTYSGTLESTSFMRDGPDHMRMDPSSSQYQWGVRNAQHYNALSGPTWQPDHWVGGECFLLVVLLGKHKLVTLWLQTKIVEGRAGLRIEDKTCSWRIMGHGSTPSYYWCLLRRGDYDCSRCTVDPYGREAYSTPYNESRAGVTTYSDAQFQLPVYLHHNETNYVSTTSPEPRITVGGQDFHVVAYAYRVCLTCNQTNAVPRSNPSIHEIRCLLWNECCGY
jgi:hypothetical protein